VTAALIDAGLVGDDADALSGKLRKIVENDDIEAGLHERFLRKQIRRRKDGNEKREYHEPPAARFSASRMILRSSHDFCLSSTLKICLMPAP